MGKETSPSVHMLVALALAEDLGDDGDVTAAATIPVQVTATGQFVARSEGVAAGLAMIEAVYEAVDPRLDVALAVEEGSRLGPGMTLATVHGPARSIVTGERTVLNFLTHLCGVATLTARYVAAVAGTGAVIRDTRKTLPGMRALEKAAVVAGGGVNHRFGLFDGLLVKDNHVAAAGGVGPATRTALHAAGGLPVQVEVDTMQQLEEALAAAARSILLDNFTVPELTAAVSRCRREPEQVHLEASGGVTLDTVAEIAATGVDAVAVGALTHSAPALDIGLDFAHEESG